MGIYLERAKELRALTEPHYNCAQAVLVPFAQRAGLSDEQAFDLAQGFGGGMQTGSVCGALTGAVMALGVLGLADRRTVAQFGRRFAQDHGGMRMCVDLLRANAQAGGQKKPHCDAMVYYAVSLVEECLAARENA